MTSHFPYTDSLIDIAVQHSPDQFDASLADHVRHTQIMVHNLIDAVERILLVQDSIQQDAQGPDILTWTHVRFTGEDFWSCIIWEMIRPPQSTVATG